MAKIYRWKLQRKSYASAEDVASAKTVIGFSK
jgi:hypothetical protein